MLYTPLTKRVMKYCFEAHAGQLDKCGIPYVNHPLHLAEQMDTEEETCAALLHDVMEDCGVSEDELRDLGVSEHALGALRMLTHDSSVPYLDYVQAMKDACDEEDRREAATIACKVKLADLNHNSQLSRLDTVLDRDKVRLRKYMEARVILGELTYLLEMPSSRFSVEVNGKPYPFRASDETLQFLSCETGRLESNRSHETAFDKFLLVEVELLPLNPGDIIKVNFDGCTGSKCWANDKHAYDVSLYGKTDACAIEDCSAQVGTFVHRRAFGEYEIAGNPSVHRYHSGDHTINFHIACR